MKINDPRVLQIPINDNDEKLVDLADYREIEIDKSRKYTWNQNEPFSLIRQEVARRLRRAQQNLPAGIRLKVVEGYRSPSIQREMFGWQQKKFKKQHPDWDNERAIKETSKFVAPPETITPHSTGGAIDLTLVDEVESELDMGTTVNNGYEGQCLMDADNISDNAKKNRKILIETLEKAGFVNYPAEWWHWSYGDQYWAATTKNERAIYGRIEK